MAEQAAIAFNSEGLIPAVARDVRTGRVLMLAWMNKEALERTLKTGRAWYYSRTRRALWQKGEQSGHGQKVHQVRLDCDGDALLLEVEQEGPGACHEGYASCFFRKVEAGPRGLAVQVAEERTFEPKTVYGGEGAGQAGSGQARAVPEASEGQPAPSWDVLGEVLRVIQERRENSPEGSYTGYLFRSGLDKILKKVGEEATEVVIAAKNGNPGPLAQEAADLLYHLLVLLVERGLPPERVLAVLAERRRG